MLTKLRWTESIDKSADTADSSDNVPGAKAIAKGLAAGHSAANPGYWIHLSGTSILTWYDAENGRFGEAPLPEQKYDDLEGVQRLLELPDVAHHRNVDKIVQAANSDAVKIAIICPPTIYGTGSGTVSTRSMQVPDMARATLEKGFGPIAGPGLTEWDNVHVDDLGDLWVRIVSATQDPSLRDNPEVFGLKGYYLAENGTHKWSDVARSIAEEASKRGYLPEPVTKNVNQKELELMAYDSTPSWARNSKGVGKRAKKYLNWEPQGKKSLWEEIPHIVALEAKSLGIAPNDKQG
jgi:nucleoside-diphosphate-sugar epimerase